MTIATIRGLRTRLSNKLGYLSSELRRRVFKRTKAALLGLLRALDPDFAVSQRGSVVADDVLDLPSRRDRPARHLSGAARIVAPVVINGDGAVASPEAVEFYIRGIFEDPPCADFAMSQLVSPDLAFLTFEEIETRLEKFLLSASVSDIKILSMRRSFYAHKERTAENRRAYSLKNRVNPQSVFWPDPTDARNRRSLYTELPFARRIPLIDKSTKIVSAGSCFATEVAHALQRGGYSYIVKEQNKGEPGSYQFLDAGELPNSSAAWGIIFNTPSFRQLVEKAFEVRSLPKILWTQEIGGKLRYLDPFRENIAFDSVDAFEANYAGHIEAAREAFLEMDLFILTLGLNEVWYFKADGSVFSRSPWRTAPSLVGYKTLSVEENVSDLVRMVEILRAHNPNVRIICTLSPIALHATFRGDQQHVVTANAHSKAVLRVAAEEFARRCKEVYYFPAYEVVTTSTQCPWTPDQRHVSPDAVKNVMTLFHMMYAK